jgi:hypothetical protein
VVFAIASRVVSRYAWCRDIHIFQIHDALNSVDATSRRLTSARLKLCKTKTVTGWDNSGAV